MKRGEVWWARLPAPANPRPVLLLSRDEAYAVRNLVTVAPLTTRIRNIPSEVPLGQADGLSKPCVANMDTLATIPKRLLDRKISSLTPAKLREAGKAIRFALDL